MSPFDVGGVTSVEQAATLFSDYLRSQYQDDEQELLGRIAQLLRRRLLALRHADQRVEVLGGEGARLVVLVERGHVPTAVVESAQVERGSQHLGVAGLGTMQVMMFAIALYFGEATGIDAQLERYFRWVSLLVATPVVLYAARPFFSAAWRSTLQTRACAYCM